MTEPRHWPPPASDLSTQTGREPPSNAACRTEPSACRDLLCGGVATPNLGTYVSRHVALTWVASEVLDLALIVVDDGGTS